MVLVPGFTTHVELLWESEPTSRFLEGLASFARVISFDRRGSGLSDPVADAPTLEQRMDDVRAVMDAAGSERAALVGISEGVSMSILFAATYPQRVLALVCSGGMAREGPGRRVGDRVQRPRRPRAEGRSRQLAAVRGRRLSGPWPSAVGGG